MSVSEAARWRKPKKSVALSGVTAGNTALCSVGQTGNDLHYRGYDILEVAESCDFEEIAHLLMHGKLPQRGGAGRLQGQAAESARPARAGALRCSNSCRAAAHPMDVMRTGASVAGVHACRRRTATTPPGARDIADHLMASLGSSMLLYWYHFSHNGQRIHVETDDDSHRRPFPAPAARRDAAGVVGAARCTLR